MRLVIGHSRILATALTAAVVAYLAWKITESPDQAVQFAFNGLAVGAIYALLAMGFTIVYSTVWFFDLYYGAAAAIGAYGVFYLRSQDGFGGNDYTNPYVTAMLAAVTAGVVAWALYEAFFHKLRPRFDRRVLYAVGGLLAVGAGGYMGLVLSLTDDTNVIASPAIGVLVAFASRAGSSSEALEWCTPGIERSSLPGRGGDHWRGAGRILRVPHRQRARLEPLRQLGSVVPDGGDRRPWHSTGVSTSTCASASRSPLIMLVATLGILLAITAATSIIFESNPRPLPEAFGSAPWTILGSNIKGFNIFTIGVSLVGFVFLLFLLRMTSFGKAVRAIGDDEEVSKVVGINTTVIIAIVFFIGAVFAAMAGLLSGHDTAIQPRMGLLLLLKGWIASVVGGIGNLYGAIVGGFALGMIEQFGIWDLAGEWKDVISFMVLILFLSFWPKGLLPRE